MNDIIRQTTNLLSLPSPVICTTPCRALGGKFSLSFSQPSQQTAILPAAVDGTLWLPGTSGVPPAFCNYPTDSGRIGPRQASLRTYPTLRAPAPSGGSPLSAKARCFGGFDVPAIPYRGTVSHTARSSHSLLSLISPPPTGNAGPSSPVSGVACPLASLPDLRRILVATVRRMIR